MSEDPIRNSRIRSAAIRLNSGDIWEGNNHREIREMIYLSNGGQRIKGKEGFILEDDRFVDRREAATIALANGQATEATYAEGELSSSDI